MPHTPLVLGLDIPNILPTYPDWVRPAGRLIWSTLIVVVAFVVIFLWTRRPKSPEPVTWAKAMLGAVGVFALFVVTFATWPHEWITFANSYLNWGKDTFVLEQSSVLPFNISRRVATDGIEVLIYVIGTTAAVFLMVQWQKRPVRQPAEGGGEGERTQTRTSAFGRPVTAG